MTRQTYPEILVEPGNGWGDADIPNLKAVFEDVRDVFCETLMYPYDSTISVRRVIGDDYPMILYRRTKKKAADR